MYEGVSQEDKRLFSLLDNKDYEGVVRFLKVIEDEERRSDLCLLALAICGIEKIYEEYGGIRLTKDEEEFEQAKIGLGELPPNTVFYEDGKGFLHGAEIMLDFVNEDNLIKQYWKEIDSD